MGEPKAAIDLLGRPLIGYAIDAARQAGLEPLVVAKRDTVLPPTRLRVARSSRTSPSTRSVGIIAALERAGDRSSSCPATCRSSRRR